VKEGGDGEVSEKSLEMRHVQPFAHLEEPGVAPSRAPGVTRDGRNEKNGSDGDVRAYNRWRPGGKTEILAEAAPVPAPCPLGLLESLAWRGQETAPTEAAGCTIEGGPDARTRVSVDTRDGGSAMKRLFIPFLVAVTAVLGMLLPPLANAATEPPQQKPQDNKIYGEIRSDASLVYIFWEGSWARGSMRFFCDDQLVGVLRHRNYTFAYVSPGTHLFWSSVANGGLVDLAVGQTYYLSFDLSAPELSILSESDGRVALKRATKYVALSQEDYRKAANTISKKWPKLKARDTGRLQPPGREPYTRPATTENMIRVPAGTAVVAEMMENLDSRFNEVDDPVWFRAAEDVYIDGKRFVLKDAPIKAVIRGVKKGRNFRRIGRLDLTVVSVAATDGTVCPMIGQLRGRGVMTGSALPAAVLAGASLAAAVGVAALVKGPEAFYRAGELIKVFTRQDIWIKPLESTTESASGAVRVSDAVKAYARGKIRCDFHNGKIPQVVEIVFEGVSDISRVELLRVAGWEIPAPLHASRLSRVKEGWIAEFGGWDLCRFLRLGEAGTQLVFGLTASDGTMVMAEAAVPVVLQ